jgi:hypothetical protein
MRAWQTWRESLGPVGLTGLLLLLTAAAAYFAVNRPLQQRVAALQAAASAPASAASQAPAQAGPEALLRWRALLPAQPDTAAQLRRLLAAAAEQGLQLQSGEYRLERQPDDRLIRYRIALPVQGSYGQVRRFAEAALARMPALALDEIEFHRDNTQQATLDARLRFTLFLRGDE